MQWFGTKVPQTRFLGQVDQDDPTNLPVGVAAVCRNIDFTRDSGGPTNATTRAGNNTAMQCVDPEAPVTGLLGFVYEPVSAMDPFFQLPLAFQPTVGSQYEDPVGSGKMTAFPQTNFDEPQAAHAIQASAGNHVFSAYSDLVAPLGGLSTMDPKAKTLEPFGMKPFGFRWQTSLFVRRGELCTPAAPLTGNGHTYEAQNDGYTSQNLAQQPVWPLTEAGVVVEAGVQAGQTPVTWKEHTMVIANCVPPPPSPVLTLGATATGTIPTAQDVYIVITLLNTAGETLASIPAKVTTIVNDCSVIVAIPALAALAGWIQNLPPAYIPTSVNVYVAIVPTGDPAPSITSYNRVITGSALGAMAVVTGSGTGGGTNYTGNATVDSVHLFIPPSGSLTSFSAVISAFPSAAVGPAGAQVTIDLNGTIAVAVAGGGGGALAWEYSIDSGGSWASIYGNSAPVIPATIVTFLFPNTLANINTVQLRIEASGGAAPAGTVQLDGFITDAYVTVLTGPVAPPEINTARVTPGQLPTPVTAPIIDRNPGAGAFAAGQDVYVLKTYANGVGETPGGPSNAIINTAANDGINVTVDVPLGPNNEQLYEIALVGIYVAVVPTGQPAPGISVFQLFGYSADGATPTITAAPGGQNPPLTNTTGPGGNIAADTTTGGANGTQGYRFAACLFVNAVQTYSGFSLGSAVRAIIDQAGWEIGAFNIPLGPDYAVGRIIPFSVADSSQAGPFDWIGNINLQVPSQNVVYPMQTLINQVNQSATAILDVVTTQAIFNFTDGFLTAENNVDDRLTIAIPPEGVGVSYLESVDRLAVYGVAGLASGAWISLGADYESFYAADSPVPVTTNGEKCYGVTDKYKGIIFALMEESGFVLAANTGNPNSWNATRRWDGMGPCGFRAWAAIGKFIFFAHRSGLYRYDQSDPDLMSKEIPKEWATINWSAGKFISISIDEDTHTVRVQVPTLGSMVPNKEICLSYIEGWLNPIKYTAYTAREATQEACRRYSFNDFSAFLCLRMKRQIPQNGKLYLNGPSWNTLPDSSFQLTQLLYASSGFDGTVQARTPGVFSDNGAGIDSVYRTVCAGLMQAVCKPEGFNLNACGYGTLLVAYIASRLSDADEGGIPQQLVDDDRIDVEPIILGPVQVAGITREVGPVVNEFWSNEFWNGKQPGYWFSLKSLTNYLIMVTGGRDPGDK